MCCRTTYVQILIPLREMTQKLGSRTLWPLKLPCLREKKQKLDLLTGFENDAILVAISRVLSRSLSSSIIRDTRPVNIY
jgi:hypothetical protein